MSLADNAVRVSSVEKDVSLAENAVRGNLIQERSGNSDREKDVTSKTGKDVTSSPANIVVRQMAREASEAKTGTSGMGKNREGNLIRKGREGSSRRKERNRVGAKCDLK